MKIGIIGAPGSGKTNLAQGIKKALDDKIDFDIVDEYVGDLSDGTGLAFGHFAGYIGNLQVTFERLAREQESTRQYEGTITCGTVVDSLIYAAMYSQLARQAPNQRAELARAATTMGAFGMIIYDTFDYDLSFYLPLSQEHRQEHEGEWNVLFDLEVAPTLAQLDLELKPILLDDGDVNNLAKAVQNVFELINSKPVDATTVE